jgi:hypothetical protein
MKPNLPWHDYKQRNNLSDLKLADFKSFHFNIIAELKLIKCTSL